MVSYKLPHLTLNLDREKLANSTFEKIKLSNIIKVEKSINDYMSTIDGLANFFDNDKSAEKFVNRMKYKNREIVDEHLITSNLTREDIQSKIYSYKEKKNVLEKSKLLDRSLLNSNFNQLNSSTNLIIDNSKLGLPKKILSLSPHIRSIFTSDSQAKNNFLPLLNDKSPLIKRFSFSSLSDGLDSNILNIAIEKCFHKISNNKLNTAGKDIKEAKNKENANSQVLNKLILSKNKNRKLEYEAENSFKDDYSKEFEIKKKNRGVILFDKKNFNVKGNIDQEIKIKKTNTKKVRNEVAFKFRNLLADKFNICDSPSKKRIFLNNINKNKPVIEKSHDSVDKILRDSIMLNLKIRENRSMKK